MSNPTIYGEAGAFDALTGNLRKAEEAAQAGHQRVIQMRLHDAIEAATQLGTMLSDGRWAAAATLLDRARDRLVKANPLEYRDPRFCQAVHDRLGEIRLTLTHLRHGSSLH